LVNPIDRGEKTEMDGQVRILPLDFNTVLRRAESRLLKLHNKIKTAPFLQERGIQEFLEGVAETDGALDFSSKVEPVFS
jgi:hypothetical protein